MKKYWIILLFCLFLTISQNAYGARIHPEKIYQNVWCQKNNGAAEVELADKTRVDCLTDDYAVEFDFANKWAEAVGQSLYYAFMTGKAPAVVLIIENGQKDMKYVKRICKLTDKFNIKLWLMTPQEVPFD